jgi:hypothetical protein
MADAVMHREQQGGAGSSPTQSIHRQMPEEEEEIMQARLRNSVPKQSTAE